ncbi:MAG: phosphatase PAP2 family protein [Thiotrichaceae bacterium]
MFVWLSDRATFSVPLLLLLSYRLLRQHQKNTYQSIIWLAATLALSDGIGQLLKSVFAQPRPCFSLQAQYAWLEPCGAALTGMPSNHALNFFAVAMFITVTTSWRKWHITLFTIAVLVAISRVYLVKHFPSQVIVGAGLGILVGWSMGYIKRKLSKN